MFLNIIKAKRLIIDRIQSIYPDKNSNYRNNVVYHILSYLSASMYINSQSAAAGWAKQDLSMQDVDKAVSTVSVMFQNKGQTDQIAKSPSFGELVNNAARKYATGAKST